MDRPGAQRKAWCEEKLPKEPGVHGAASSRAPSAGKRWQAKSIVQGGNSYFQAF
jgi:hypothetical protein